MKTKHVIVGLALGAALVVAPLVKANPIQLELVSGTSTAFGTISLTGLNFSGTINGWTLTAGASDTAAPSLEIQSLNITANGSSPLWIDFMGDDYTLPQVSLALSGTSETAQSAPLVGSFGSYYLNQTNGSSTLTQLTSATFNDTTTTGAMSQNTTGTIPAGEYDLWDQLEITQGTGGVTADLAFSAVPDGGSTLLLLGLGITAVTGIGAKFSGKRN
jgi:hypothetical protein